MADIKETLSILVVKLAERAAAATEYATAEAANAFKTGLNTAISVLEEAAAKRPEGTLADRVHIVLMNLEGWKSTPPPVVLPGSPVAAYRLGLERARARLEEALKDQPMPLTGNADVAQVKPKEPCPMWSFMAHGEAEPRTIDARDIVSVVRAMVPIDGTAAKRWASVIHMRNGGNFVVAEHPAELVPRLVKTRLECGCTTPLMGDLCEPHQEQQPPFAPPKAPVAPTLTKCEKLIYDAARQALADPSVMRTRAQLTQQIDYWLYQLQNANLARPKPEPLKD